MGTCFFPRFLSSFHPTKSIFFTIFFQHFPQSTFIFPCFHFCTLIAASAWSTCLAECFRLSMHIHSANRFGLHLTYLQFVRADDVFCMPIIQFSTMNRNVKRSSFQLKISFSHSELLLPFFLAISHIIFAHLYIRARNKCMHIIPMFGWLLWFFFLISIISIENVKRALLSSYRHSWRTFPTKMENSNIVLNSFEWPEARQHPHIWTANWPRIPMSVLRKA